MAGVQGFEPRYLEPESRVLPLDDTPKKNKIQKTNFKNSEFKEQKICINIQSILIYLQAKIEPKI
jgi:hypothetical protein